MKDSNISMCCIVAMTTNTDIPANYCTVSQHTNLIRLLVNYNVDSQPAIQKRSDIKINWICLQYEYSSFRGL